MKNYSFPDEGITITAQSLAEALEKKCAQEKAPVHSSRKRKRSASLPTS